MNGELLSVPFAPRSNLLGISRWDHPDDDKAWKQPEGSPSEMAFFVAFIGLTRVLSRCVRTVVGCLPPWTHIGILKT